MEVVNKDYAEKRRRMVDEQIRGRGINDERVLRAMEEVPRHLFVPERMRERAYADEALPIGEVQTISQPYMVALMSECLELRGDESVLEVGTGSGYQAAVLSCLAREVYSVEIVEKIFLQAKERLAKLPGYENVCVIHGDGSAGYKKEAPYDRIIVAAAAREVPEKLLEQLKDGGILVMPIGGAFMQMLLRVRKIRGEFREESITSCVFVPLVEGL
ncbi:MAG: protein-L-isoaspartate O-methyltransferase [Candidatus Nanohalarchaeota archaeon]|nr:MAG: protein-L-isoaspartate O-methyltransferase [Candidatus Nanohaloarchaeota archaeon]